MADDQEIERQDAKATERRREQDREDYNNEIAGREAPRIARFLGEAHRNDGNTRQRKREKTVDTVTRLHQMLNDPAYAALYDDTNAVLRRYEQAAERALEKAKDDYAALKIRAATLPGGRAVFLDRNGDVRTEYGGLVDAALVGGGVWPRGAPTYEDLQSAKDRVDAVRRYQVNDLGTARNELEDEDNPPAKERLEAIQRDLADNASPSVRAELEPVTPASAEPQIAAEFIAKPSL